MVSSGQSQKYTYKVMARGRKEREIKRSRITVIGEGLTEKWYFEHLRSIKGFRYDCKPRFFTQQSYSEMSKLIDWVLENGGIAVCVCDADITRTNPTEQARLKELKQKFSNNDNVIICDSMPSIEFWFLIHYLNTSKYFNDSKEVIQALRRWLPEYSKSGAMLEKPQWVLNLCSDGKLEKARATAESLTLESPSYSNIHKAIELFEESNKV